MNKYKYKYKHEHKHEHLIDRLHYTIVITMVIEEANILSNFYLFDDCSDACDQME